MGLNQLRIVIGASLLPSGDGVLAAGMALAQALAARVHVVHAVPTEVSFPLTATVERERRSLLEAALDRLRPELAGSVRPEVEVRCGAAHRVLLERARCLCADLVVIGARDRENHFQGLGTTADRVLRRSCCPVLVVRGQMRLPITRALFPVDLSPLSAETYHIGLRWLKAISSRELPEISLLLVEAEPKAASGAEMLARFVGNHHPADWPPPRTWICHGEPRREILREIEAQRPQLVVLGTHGSGGFERLLLGGVTTDLLHQSPVSLLVIPPAAALAEETALEAWRRSQVPCSPDPHVEFYG